MRFQFTLARELGYRSVAELRRRMSVREYMQWVALYELEASEREKAMKGAKRKGARPRRGRR